MQRKKWTSQIEVTDSILKVREKKKWQLALRRYVIEKNISAGYAYYFGLTINDFREWIELQFTGEMAWGNFGSVWQFVHIVPVNYFDFAINEDLILCWSFINIRIEPVDIEIGSKNRIDIIAAKQFFESLYNKTAFDLCRKMIEKITRLQELNNLNNSAIEEFILQKKDRLNVLATLEIEEFNRLNTGTSLNNILKEKELLKKFG